MSNLAKIMSGTRVIHDSLDKHVFLLRYRKPVERGLTLRDHYCHLLQLLPLYELLENYLKDADFFPKLLPEFSELLFRSERIKRDLAFLKSKMGKDPAIDTLTATNSYLNYLTKSIKTHEDRNEILISHFLVRILGDLFGGESLKGYVQQLYLSHKLVVERNNSEGIKFYEFSDNMLERLVDWLDKQHFSPKFIEYCNHAFVMHFPIFNALEAGRFCCKWFSC